MTTLLPKNWLSAARRRLRAALPLRWLRGYNRVLLSADMVAGLTASDAR